jgi:hypothetical protein
MPTSYTYAAKHAPKYLSGRIPMKVHNSKPLVQPKYMPGHIPMTWLIVTRGKTVNLQLHAQAYTYERGITPAKHTPKYMLGRIPTKVHTSRLLVQPKYMPGRIPMAWPLCCNAKSQQVGKSNSRTFTFRLFDFSRCRKVVLEFLTFRFFEFSTCRAAIRAAARHTFRQLSIYIYIYIEYYILYYLLYLI